MVSKEHQRLIEEYRSAKVERLIHFGVGQDEALEIVRYLDKMYCKGKTSDATDDNGQIMGFRFYQKKDDIIQIQDCIVDKRVPEQVVSIVSQDTIFRLFRKESGPFYMILNKIMDKKFISRVENMKGCRIDELKSCPDSEIYESIRDLMPKKLFNAYAVLIIDPLR